MNTLLLIASLSAAPGSAQFLQPEQTDWTSNPANLSAKVAQPITANRSRDAVQFSWALGADEVLTTQAGLSANSKAYWLDVAAQDLAKGVDLPLTSGGAVIRISPVGSARVDAKTLSLYGDGQPLGKSAVEHFADADDLAKTGAGFSAGSVAFRLGADVKPSQLTLALGSAGKSDQPFVVHVFEPESAMTLTVNSVKAKAFAGGTHAFRLALPGVKLGASDVTGYVASPTGERIGEMSFASDGSGINGSIALADSVANSGGLWEAHLFVKAQGKSGVVMRDIKLPFQVIAPTAAFAPKVVHSDFAFDLQVNVASEGRYEARGVLFGTMADGSMVPVAAAASANWLAPGQQTLSLAFDAQHVVASDAQAPYEVRFLELNDQSRMFGLWHQERAIVIDQ